MKHLFALALIFALAQQAIAQYPNQDCVGAVPLCNDRYELPYTFNGTGYTKELYTRPTCLINGENNSAWYKLQFNGAGQLVFSITPYSQYDDYDFALYNLSGLECTDIPNGVAPEVRCNFAVTYGVATGIDTGGGGTSASANGPDFLLPLQVDSGEVLYLVIDNFTTNGQGFSIDFAGTTASMISSDSFYVTSGYSTIVADTIKVSMFFNQTFYCATLSNDYSEFTLVDDTGDTLQILSATCDGTASLVVVNALHPAHAVASVSVHYQDGFDGNIILAQCGSQELDGTPKTFEARNGPGMLDFTHVQIGDSFVFTPIIHPTASFEWHVNDSVMANNAAPFSSIFNLYQPYEVCIVGKYGYVADTVCKDYYITGLYAVDALSAFQLYPNPTHAEVSIALPYGVEWVQVTDLNGKAVAHYNASVPATTITLPTAHLPQGLYLVQVATRHGIAVQKLHVVH